MLFTRCPSCDTTFRVTDEALAKAGGQVRCGRCASVFNAYTELRETAPQEEISSPSPAPQLRPFEQLEGKSEVAARSEDGYDNLSIAAVMAQVKLSEERAQPEQHEAESGQFAPAAQRTDSLSAENVQAVLDDDFSESAVTAIWSLENPPLARPASGGWKFAALLALVALGVQGIHHFRSELAGQAVVGPWLQQAYGFFGMPLAPRWNIEQYQILDWTATAKPTARERGTLTITARIHNRGPLSQPYPQIHLQLKDRWDETVGSRIFNPTEYLKATTNTLMSAGETTQAQLEIVDPGEDAYGFELDVCVEAQADVITCGNDAVFL